MFVSANLFGLGVRHKGLPKKIFEGAVMVRCAWGRLRLQ